MKLSSLFAASVIALGATLTSAQAVTITVLDQALQMSGNVSSFAPSSEYGTNWGVATSGSISIVGPGNDLSPASNKSPWEGDEPSFSNGQYFSVGGPGEPSPQTVTFTDGPIQSIKILIGSVDSYNSIVFNFGLTSAHTVSGNDLLSALGVADSAFPETVGLFLFDGGSEGISNIQFSSSQAAIEFAVAAVPLPAGALLLLTGLGGIGVMRRMKRKV